MHLLIYLMHLVHIKPFRVYKICFFIYWNYAIFHSPFPKFPPQPIKITSPLLNQVFAILLCSFLFLQFLTSLTFWTGDACHLVFTDFARPCFGSKLFFILALREKCPNTEFFLVGTFLYLD